MRTCMQIFEVLWPSTWPAKWSSNCPIKWLSLDSINNLLFFLYIHMMQFKDDISYSNSYLWHITSEMYIYIYIYNILESEYLLKLSDSFFYPKKGCNIFFFKALIFSVNIHVNNQTCSLVQNQLLLLPHF